MTTEDHWNGRMAALARSEEARVAGLPPFEEKPVCRKCGAAPKDIAYRKPRTFQLHDSRPHAARGSGTMRYVCGYCSFTWETQTLDAETVAVEPGATAAMVTDWDQG